MTVHKQTGTPKQMGTLNWDDLRIFLELARTGSLSAAARALRISHATVGRRVAALEEGLGRSLVDRRADGYSLTADGEEAVVSLVEPGQVFAEADMFASARYPLSAEAVEPTRVLVFTAEEFFAAMRTDPEVGFRVVEALSQRIRGFVEATDRLRKIAATARELAAQCGRRDVVFGNGAERLREALRIRLDEPACQLGRRHRVDLDARATRSGSG